MKIKNDVMMEDDFIEALNWLAQRQMTVKECMTLVSASRKAQDHVITVQETRKALILKHCLKDKDGNALSVGQKIQFASKEEENQATVAVTELLSQEFDFPIENKVKVSEDDVATPRTCFLLESLIEIVPAKKA